MQFLLAGKANNLAGSISVTFGIAILLTSMQWIRRAYFQVSYPIQYCVAPRIAEHVHNPAFFDFIAFLCLRPG